MKRNVEWPLLIDGNLVVLFAHGANDFARPPHNVYRNVAVAGMAAGLLVYGVRLWRWYRGRLRQDRS